MTPEDEQAMAELNELRDLHTAWAQGTDRRGDHDRVMTLLGSILTRLDALGKEALSAAQTPAAREASAAAVLEACITAMDESLPEDWGSAAFIVHHSMFTNARDSAGFRLLTKLSMEDVESLLREVLSQIEAQKAARAANPKVLQ